MVTALILSGGVGTRFGDKIPKQYLVVDGKPIIGFSLDTFQENENTNQIVIVASPEWNDFILKYVKENGISKFMGFAAAGASRQHSILHGLRKILELGGAERDVVVIHDAVRPCVGHALIDECVRVLERYDMSMPVIPVKDTAYLSDNGRTISALLQRDRLFAGQAPEGCHLGSYYRVNAQLSDERLSAVRGTCAIGYEHGLSVGMFPGSESNIKITTQNDMDNFRFQRRGKS